MHLDNSACNLASLNLLKFLDEDGTFDVEGFKAARRGACSPPRRSSSATPTTRPSAIGETSRRFRQLGLGYANLGAMLMALGLPYDSDEGRAWAAAVTALMTGHAYATSARTAARMGPFAGYAENARAHAAGPRPAPRRGGRRSTRSSCPTELLSAAQQAWDEACELAAERRRAQLAGLACSPPPAPSAS